MGARTNIVPQRISRGNKTGATSGRLVQYLMDCVWMKAVKVGGGGGRWRYEVEGGGGGGVEMVVGGGIEMQVGEGSGRNGWGVEVGDGGGRWTWRLRWEVEVGHGGGRCTWAGGGGWKEVR